MDVPHHPNTCGCTVRLHWWSSPSSGGADDNLRQLTGCEVPVRRRSVHSLAAVTAQATLVPSKLCSHCSVSPQYLPIHWGHQLGATSWGRRTLLGAGTLRHAPALVEALGLACQALSLRGALGKHQLRQEWVLKTSTRLK